MSSLEPFLRVTPLIDWEDPGVLTLARELANRSERPVEVAKRCFEWVRDQIPHTSDYGLDPVTCSASEVLREKTGFCYAKSHLLAALLRANGIPTGFVYQRLALDNGGIAFCLHGLNAIWLPDVGWYRVDARGDRADLHADFTPPTEVLPFARSLPGECLFETVRAEPFPVVINALRRHRTRIELEANLPDSTSVD